MTFDPTLSPCRDGLSEPIAAAMNRIFFARRPLGLNVQFVTLDGALDERSFATASARDSFTGLLASEGRDYAISF